MAIPLGLDPSNEPRESYWKRDDAVDWDGTPDEARKLYDATGEARHLALKESQLHPPTRISIRALTAKEAGYVRGEATRAIKGEFVTNPMLLCYLCTAFGLDFPDWPREIKTAKGVIQKWSAESGMRRLSDDLLDHVTAALGEEFYAFYGRLIRQASEATAEDFFPSLQASTPTNSPR